MLTLAFINIGEIYDINKGKVYAVDLHILHSRVKFTKCLCENRQFNKFYFQTFPSSLLPWFIINFVLGFIPCLYIVEIMMCKRFLILPGCGHVEIARYFILNIFWTLQNFYDLFAENFAFYKVFSSRTFLSTTTLRLPEPGFSIVVWEQVFFFFKEISPFLFSKARFSSPA